MSTRAPAPRRLGGRPIHVMLVDDHPATRHGIRQLLMTQGDLDMVAETGSASVATSELARWADIAVIDYYLGGPDGLWLTQQIKRRPSAPPVLIYSAFADATLAAAAIVADADGLLAKTALTEELCIAIRRLFHGRQYFPAIPRSIAGALRSRLETRDQPIFSMVLHGAGSREIRSLLGLSAADLAERRQVILSTIAPCSARPGRTVLPRAPLDYERPRPRRRYPAAR
jgi:DNA-binding NarL/FixJ family response regulator